MEMHWCIIFKFQIPIPLYRALRLAVLLVAAVLLAGGSSRAMLASARSLVLAFYRGRRLSRPSCECGDTSEYCCVK